MAIRIVKKVSRKKKLLEYLLQNVPLLYWAGVGEDEESDTDTTIKQKKEPKKIKQNIFSWDELKADNQTTKSLEELFSPFKDDDKIVVDIFRFKPIFSSDNHKISFLFLKDNIDYKNIIEPKIVLDKNLSFLNSIDNLELLESFVKELSYFFKDKEFIYLIPSIVSVQQEKDINNIITKYIPNNKSIKKVNFILSYLYKHKIYLDENQNIEIFENMFDKIYITKFKYINFKFVKETTIIKEMPKRYDNFSRDMLRNKHDFYISDGNLYKKIKYRSRTGKRRGRNIKLNIRKQKFVANDIYINQVGKSLFCDDINMEYYF